MDGAAIQPDIFVVSPVKATVPVVEFYKCSKDKGLMTILSHEIFNDEFFVFPLLR